MSVMRAGPETWWIHYPSASGGMQSPIDIETEETLLDAEFGRNPLEVHYHLQAAHGAGDSEEGFGVDEMWTLVNSGVSLRVNITNTQSCTSIHLVSLKEIMLGHVVDDSCESTLVLKRMTDILSISYDFSIYE